MQAGVRCILLVRVMAGEKELPLILARLLRVFYVFGDKRRTGECVLLVVAQPACLEKMLGQWCQMTFFLWLLST